MSLSLRCFAAAGDFNSRVVVVVAFSSHGVARAARALESAGSLPGASGALSQSTAAAPLRLVVLPFSSTMDVLDAGGG